MRTSKTAVCKWLALPGITLAMLGAVACSYEPVAGSGAAEFLLSVTPASGGTITSADGSIHCPGQCEIARPPGSPIELIATPAAGALFDRWTEGCSGQRQTTCTLVLAAPISVAARFSTCSDGVKNGTEADIDCGGATCGRCGVGQGCAEDSDCSDGLTCASGTCVMNCSASSVKILGTRNPTITPAIVPAGSTATVNCRYPTYQFLFDSTIVQDFTTNSASKQQQAITCQNDGTWRAPNGELLNAVNCVGFATCNGCALPGSGGSTLP